MAFLSDPGESLEWYYSLPMKKDRTQVYKLLQAYLIAMGILIVVFVIVGISANMPRTELLKAFALIGGFLTVVMLLCYPLTILLMKGIFLWLGFLIRLTGGHHTKSDAQEKPSKSSELTFHFRLDGEKLHSWSAVETKGGRHIPYSSIRKLRRCASGNRIEAFTTLGRTILYAESDDLETVWHFLTAHCPSAETADK